MSAMPVPNEPDDFDVPDFDFGEWDADDSTEEVNDSALNDSALNDLRDKLMGTDPVDNPVEPVPNEPEQPIRPDNNPEEIDFEFEAEKLLRSLEFDLSSVELEYKSELTRKEELDAEEAILREKLRAIAAEKATLHEKTYEMRVRTNRIKREMADAERQLKIEQQEKKTREELLAERGTWDERTKDALWRTGANGTPVAFAHQYTAAYKMAACKRGIIADGMGVGKTLESVMAMAMLGAKRLLILAPGDVASDFARAVKKWAPERPVIILNRLTKAVQKQLLEMMMLNEDACVILNYEAWAHNKNLLTWLKDCRFDSIICDEAHWLKDTSTSAYNGVNDIVTAANWCKGCDKFFPAGSSRYHCDVCYEDLQSSIRYAIMMTGTLILNNPQDAFGPLHLIRPDIFPYPRDFRYTFADYTGTGWGPGGEARLAQKVSGFYIRRVMGDTGITLPPQETIIHEIELDPMEYPLQAKIMKMLWEDAQVQIKDEKISIANALALITRQRQATVWPGGIYMNLPQFDASGWPMFDENNAPVVKRIHVGQDYQESCKLDKAMDIYAELTAGGHRVVMFSMFASTIEEMHRRLPYETAVFNGSTPANMREAIKHDFNRETMPDPKKATWKGLLAHYRTGGIGLNLTAATAIIVLDEDWSDGKNQQAYGRIDRIGQTENTQVHILRHVGPGKSIDVWQAALIERKRGLVEGFETSIEELRGAFED
jgi:SNF2 family DNA or RNA helicase